MKALVLDVDGVLTDGGIFLDDDGRELKRFHARDGVGIQLAKHAGWKVLFCTARESQPARRRAEELGAQWAIGVSQKDQFLEEWLGKRDISWSDVAYVGDDLQDLCVLEKVGWPIAVGDAALEVKAAAKYVTQLDGGRGAVRDAVEWLLTKHGVKAEAIHAFLNRKKGFAVGKLQFGGDDV